MSMAALSGNQMAESDFGLLAFTKGFIAELVANGIRDITPRAPEARRGFANVVKLLDEQAQTLGKQGKGWEVVLPVARVANELRLSPSGGVEGWERALHLAQLTFTTVCNPDYDEVELSIDGSSARYEVERLPEVDQSLVREAAKRFLVEWQRGA